MSNEGELPEFPPGIVTMSQTNKSLLDEVMQWSQETCRLEVKSVLPKLTSLHHESESWDDHIRVLRIITDMFLPHIGLAELENKCFSKILPKAATMFKGMIKEILDQVGGLSSQNTELCAFLRNMLQALMQILNAFSACVRHVSSFEETLDLHIIRSLPVCILKVLRETFQHCKDSEVVYCGRLSLVADLLQGLFKEAYSLQKSLLEVLDRISLGGSATEDEVSYIVGVIHTVLDICSVISNLDIALHANTWKFLIKQSLKYQSLVEEHLNHGDISKSLSDNLVVSFHNCVELAEQIKQAGLQESKQSTEYKLFQKTAKMCRFFANTLVHYTKEFKCFLEKYCKNFHQLYLQIATKFPPSLGAPELPTGLSGELNVAALVPMDAFLLQLLPLRLFAETVLQEDLSLSPEHELPQCLLLVSIMGQLASQSEDVQQLWYLGSQFSEDTPRLPLYRAIFLSFRRCHIERKIPVLLPGVMLKGQAQTNVSLHQHVCVQLCASVAVLPPAYFPVLERCLVDVVLQADTQTALLATDVWCFTARYGTAELCLHHVLLIAQLVKTCATPGYQLFHLALLLRRMVFLMTPNHQMELVTRFPPSDVENLTVWHHVLLRALSQDARRHVEMKIIGFCEKITADWQNRGFKLGQISKVNEVLLSLLLVVRSQSSSEEQCVLTASRIVTQIWLRMSPDQLQSFHVLRFTMQLLLSVTANLVKNIESHVLHQALLCLCEIISQKCSDHMLLATLEFLSSLGKTFIPPENQSQILPRLSRLFGLLLAAESWLLHQHALEAFSCFAENTNHEEVISQSLCVEDTKAKVVNYLSKTLNPQENTETRLQRLKQEAAVIDQHNKKLENGEQVIKPSAEPEIVREPETVAELEPCPKRARQETNPEEYSRYIQTAESALKALQSLIEAKVSTTPLPPWLGTRLHTLQTLITHITSLTHTAE